MEQSAMETDLIIAADEIIRSLCRDEETVTFLIMKHDKNTNVIFQSQFLHCFPSFQVLLALY